jgi:hypothetical protein
MVSSGDKSSSTAISNETPAQHATPTYNSPPRGKNFVEKIFGNAGKAQGSKSSTVKQILNGAEAGNAAELTHFGGAREGEMASRRCFEVRLKGTGNTNCSSAGSGHRRDVSERSACSPSSCVPWMLSLRPWRYDSEEKANTAVEGLIPLGHVSRTTVRASLSSRIPTKRVCRR